MAKKHQPLNNLGAYAHPQKANWAKPTAMQTVSRDPKLISASSKSADKGKHSKDPGFTKGGKKIAR